MIGVDDVERGMEERIGFRTFADLLRLGLSDNISIVIQHSSATQNLHLHIPDIIRVEQQFHKMRLSKRDVEKDSVIFHRTVYLYQISSTNLPRILSGSHLLEIFAGVFLDFIRRTPRAAVDHGIQGTLVKGYVDRAGGDCRHVTNVDSLPLDSGDIFVSLCHEINYHG